MRAGLRLKAISFSAASLAACVTILACSGGDKKQDVGQPDYRDRVLDVLSMHGITPEEGDDPALLAGRLKLHADAWKALRPPPELSQEHRRYGDALSSAAEAFAMLMNDESVLGSSAVELLEAYESWDAAFRHHFDVELFKVSGSAMLPALCDGDTLAISRLDNEIQRWEIVVFNYHLEAGRVFIKRIVGLPGETIEVREGVIKINGETVDGDTYALSPANYVVQPFTVPSGRYYVLGDNRRNSFDSHAFIPGSSADPDDAAVPIKNIIGTLPADTTGCKRE